MSNRHSSVKVGVFIMGLAALLSVRSSSVAAQAGHDHADAQDAKAGALIKVVREATDRYQDVEVAKADGYALQFAASADRTSVRWACTSSTVRWSVTANSIPRVRRSSSTNRCPTAS